MKIVPVFLASVALATLCAGCHSQPKHGEKENTRSVAPCCKSPEPTDTPLLVIQWKRHTSHAAFHDVSYFTFHYTPKSDEPCSYETVGAMICERYVTSYELSPTTCLLGGRHEPVTKIVVNADKIVRIGTSAPRPRDTSDCTCGKP